MSRYTGASDSAMETRTAEEIEVPEEFQTIDGIVP